MVEPLKPKAYVSRCGQHHYGGIGVRIQNSKEEAGTQFGEWPNMCAVLNRYVSSSTSKLRSLVISTRVF